MNINELYELSGLTRNQYVDQLNLITGESMRYSTFDDLLSGKWSPTHVVQSVLAAANIIENDVLPALETIKRNVSPDAIRFYNAAANDPQILADFEWWGAACKANPKLKNIHHSLFYCNQS